VRFRQVYDARGEIRLSGAVGPEKARSLALQIALGRQTLHQPGRRKEWPRFGRPPLALERNSIGQSAKSSPRPVVSKSTRLQSRAPAQLAAMGSQASRYATDVDLNAGNAPARACVYGRPKAIRS